MGARRRLAVPLAAALAACAGASALSGEAPSRGDEGARRDASEVAYAVEGYTRPTADAGCASNVGVPRDYVPATVTVKFAVYPDGGVGAFEFVTPVPHQLARSLRRAIASCRWKPGRDPEGNPAAIWVIMPVRFR